MRNIKFTVEDSKVAEILKVILNSNITVHGIEVTNTQYIQVIKDSGSNSAMYQHDQSIGQNEVISTIDITSNVKLVGGTIFYIDDTTDGEYQFFDADGNLIENVQVGDKPYTYRVVKQGSKDKYYVYHDEVYDNLRWTYYKDKNYVYESLNAQENTDSGKRNTEKVLKKDRSSYTTADSNGIPTIWYQLRQVRNTKVGGCDDWFVPSRHEINLLEEAIRFGSITGGTIAGSSYNTSVFKNKYLWSSSEYSSQRAWWWHCYQTWYSCHKNDTNSVFFVRAF